MSTLPAAKESPAVAKRRRPRSLAEVAAWGATPAEQDALLREFLDEFYARPDTAVREAMLRAEPPPTGNERTDAYFAAVAEHLAQRYRLTAPAWVNAAPRFLRRAHFPCGLESLKATLLAESPPAFRRRMIFVGADPLYRPRRDRAGFVAEPLAFDDAR